MRFNAIAATGTDRCATLISHGIHVPGKGDPMLSTFAGYLGAIGSDVLSIGQAVLGLVSDLAGAGSSSAPGGFGGTSPPGQYPLA